MSKENIFRIGIVTPAVKPDKVGLAMVDMKNLMQEFELSFDDVMQMTKILAEEELTRITEKVVGMEKEIKVEKEKEQQVLDFLGPADFVTIE